MGRVVVSVTTDLPEVGRRVAAAGAAAQPMAEAMLAAAGEEIKDATIPILIDYTPRRSGDLAASTAGEVSVGADTATIDLYQPALSKPGPGGRGGGTEYVRWVIEGRGPVDAAPGSALASTDWPHPWKHSAAADPNPYNEAAAPDMQEAMDAIAARHAQELLEKLVAMM